MKKIFLISFFVLFLSSTIFGQSHAAAGFVPCGEPGNPCKLCHIFVMAKTIIDFIFKVVAVLAALMFVIGGFTLLTSAGNPSRTENGRKILTSTVIGLAIVLGSWLVINTIMVSSGLVRSDL